MSSLHRPRIRAVVIGGSLGGLSAAFWLLQAGAEVQIFERAGAALADRGTGIVLHPSTVRFLALRPEEAMGEVSAGTRWFRYLGNDGTDAYVTPSHYRFTSYSVLYRSLLRSCGEERYHSGEECTGFEQDDTGVTAAFASGRRERCDLLVFADGINSTGRRLLFPPIQPSFAGYVAWRGTVGEAQLSTASFAVLGESISYALLPDSHSLIYPIPPPEGAPEAGGRLINWLWYRNVEGDRELRDLLTNPETGQWRTSLPPGAVPPHRLECLRREAEALPPQFVETIRRTAHPFIQVVFDIEVPRMVHERVCLTGDAAFTARPHAAAGTAKAAENAWALGEAVRRHGMDVIAALRAWEPGQLALGRQLLARSRQAGERLQSGRWAVGEPLSFGLYRAGDSIFPH